MDIRMAPEQSPIAKDRRKRARDNDNLENSRGTKRQRKANPKYQEYEVPKTPQKGSANTGREATTSSTPTRSARSTLSKEGTKRTIEFALTSKKKIEVTATISTPVKSNKYRNGHSTPSSAPAPALPSTPTTGTPSQPQSGRAKRSKAMRRQKSDFYRGGGGPTELSPSLKQCQKLLTKLMGHNCAWPFNKPVDPVALKIPDYFDIIKFPMDLGTIREQLVNGFYDDIEDFANDVRMVWKNASTYNKPTSDVCIMASELSTVFEGEFRKIEPEEMDPVPTPSVVPVTPQQRKRAPGVRSKAGATGSGVAMAGSSGATKVPERGSVKARRDSVPRPKTPRKEENGMPKPRTPRKSEEEKKGGSSKKKKGAVDDSQRKQLQRELERMRKKMDGLQQQIQDVTSNTTPTKTTPRKRQQPAVRQMNRDEKRRLSEKINSLPGKYLGEVVRIIQESVPIRDDDAPPPEEIEIDMDALGNGTLRKLETFVDDCLSKKKNPIAPIPQPVVEETQKQNGDVPMRSPSDDESDSDSDSYTESEGEDEDDSQGSSQPIQSAPPVGSSDPSQAPPSASSPPVNPTKPPSPVPAPAAPASASASPPAAPSGLSVSSVLPFTNGPKSQQQKLSSSTPLRKSSGSLSFLESLSSLKSLGTPKGLSLSSSQSVSSPTATSPTPSTATPDSAPKSEEKVVINEKGWSQLNGDKNETEEKVASEDKTEEKATSENGDSSLWSQFRERDQQKQQKEKELKDKEEEERKQRIAQQEQLRKEEETRQREREEAEQQRIREQEEAEQQRREQLRLQAKLEREKKAADAALQNEQGLMMREFETGVDGFAT